MMEYYWVLRNCSIELAQPLPYVQYVVIGLSVWRPRLLEVPIVDFLCAGDGIRHSRRQPHTETQNCDFLHHTDY